MADLANNSNGIIENFNTKNGNFICGVVEGFYGRPWTTEQRKDLFHKLKRWGMDSYLYAPKDDYKHRAFWRELYSVEEADHLTSLVTAAREAGITFFYALSPGLDITYSSGKEVAALKRKLEQVTQFGCSAFALLFDDIEPEMSDADKEVFQSFAHAQVSVTNEVFQHLGHPQFLLCPTQYCSTRATPNVRNSEYLNTLGAKLAQGIDIMWTGPKVISRILTLESIEEITEVLRRPPVIWDNLHANDYDQKRVFLGPYAGRSPALIPHLRGVLSNPNCEYGANFVPIHTLAQWSRASGNTTPSESVSADIKLETEDTSNNGTNGVCAEDALPNNLSPDSYHPRHALSLALRDWLPEFNRPRQANGPSSLAKPAVSVAVAAAAGGVPPIINTCLALTATTTTAPIQTTASQLHTLAEICTSVSMPINNGILPALLPALPPLPLPEEPQPMECGGTDEALPSIEVPVIVPEDKHLTVQDLSLLCDLFYLPFEHGPHGLQLLQEFNWLKGNAHLVSGGGSTSTDGESQTNTATEWFSRATKLSDLTRQLNDLFTRLAYCANRELLYELYPYVWDMRGVVGLLDSYVRWLASGSFPPVMPSYTVGNYTWFSKGWKETYMSGDQEPWVFRGGLTADLQRLIPVDSGQDLFVYKSPDVPSPKIYTIRPMDPTGTDRTRIYSFCRAAIGLDSSLEAFPELAGDHLVGAFVYFTPQLCLLVEDETRVVGFAAAALDAQQLHARLEVEGSWVSQMKNKYPVSLFKQPSETKAQELINNFHMDRTAPPEAVHAQHPSVMTCSILESVCDGSVSKRLVTCLLAALRANGSFGVYSALETSDVKTIDLYAKLGFVEVIPGVFPNNIFMARSF